MFSAIFSSSLPSQVGMIFILLAVGFVCRKASLIDDSLQSGISRLVINIGMPCNILAAANRAFDPKHANSIILILFFSMLYFMVALLLSWGGAKALHLDNSKRPIFILLSTFSNSAFIGYPVISIFLPETGIFYASFFNVVFNIVFFTYGTVLISDQKRFSPKAAFTNINTIASILMIILYLLQIKLPGVVQLSLESLGSLSTPLSMLVIGSMLGSFRLRHLFTDKSLYVSSLLRLAVLPCLMFVTVKLAALPADVATVMVVLSGLPSGTTTAMIAEQYQREPLYASKGILLSTLLFIPSILLLAILQSLL